MALKSVKILEKINVGIDKKMSLAIICIDVKKKSKEDRP